MRHGPGGGKSGDVSKGKQFTLQNLHAIFNGHPVTAT